MLISSHIAYGEAQQAGALVDLICFEKPMHVIALFENSLYLEAADGRLICLCNEDLSLGPISLSCSNWKNLHTERVCVGQTLLVKHASLILHANAVVNLATARNLLAPNIPHCDATAICLSLVSLQSMLQADIPCSNGFAPLLPLFLSDTYRDVCPSVQDNILANIQQNVQEKPFFEGNIFLQEAGASVAAFIRCFDGLTPDTNRVFDTQGIIDFIGLGPGLTPSGDDFVVGVMLALRYCKCFSLLDMLAKTIGSEKVACLTNKISYAYLQAATLGHVSSILHDAANAFCVHSATLSTSLERLRLVGHSSGWDAFAGFAITMKIVHTKGLQ